uniref:Peptidase_M13 domain-containing protein n=1 Tax=Parastrongyloides trichosuri TaxID=131310 RepID=A0A0N4ZDF1_PARTI
MTRELAFELCVEENKLFTSHAFYVYFLNNYLGIEQIEDSFNVIHKLFDYIKKGFRKLIEKQTWLGSYAQSRFREKNEELEYDIDFNLNELFEFFSIDNCERVYNHFDYKYNDSYEVLKEKIKNFIRFFSNKDSRFFNSSMDLFEPTAKYDIPGNIFYVSFGLLTLPTFNLTLPPVMMFGLYGSIIAQEIAHGFSEAGRWYISRQGPGDMFDESTAEKYEYKRKCINLQYQYEKHSISGMYANSELTLSETIADNMGAKIAYTAFKIYEEEHGSEESKIPGLLHYTNDQLFYIGYAQNHCDKYTVGGSIYALQNYPSPPGEIRVMGALVNQPEFSKVYYCSVDSRMYYFQRCEILI